jgi:hypothetical protein
LKAEWSSEIFVVEILVIIFSSEDKLPSWRPVTINRSINALASYEEEDEVK